MLTELHIQNFAIIDQLDLDFGPGLIILTGDHGESMAEHKIFFDHHGLYDPTIHVPLIVRAPGKFAPGARVGGMVRHIDIVPTLLDLLGLPPHEQADGRSLAPLAARGPTRPPPRPPRPAPWPWPRKSLPHRPSPPPLCRSVPPLPLL